MVTLSPRAALVLLSLSGPFGCGRAPAQREPPREAGVPVAAGDTLAAFDALAPGANEAPLYPPRVTTRLRLAPAVARERVVALPAGLAVRVAWETRDDLVFAERDLTLVRATVDHLDPGTSCVINRASKVAWPPAAGTLDSVRVDLSIDYACTEGRNTTSLAVAIGTVSADGFTRVGPATGKPEPPPADEASPPAVTAVHFAPKVAALDAAATAAIEEFAKVLQADEALVLCLATQAEKAPPELQKQRLEAVRKALGERGVSRARVALEVGTGQAPPAVDDLELWPHDLVCKAPRVRKRR